MRRRILAGLSVTALLLAGCASRTTPELARARTAYDQASKGPAAAYDPADLHTAAETLHAAEQTYDQAGDSQASKDVAYTAERRAEIADVRGGALASIHRRDALLAQISQTQSTELQRTSAELERTHQQLEEQRRAAREAEQRAAQAMSELAHVASVRQQAQNVVITLSGSVLFASGKFDLLPEARARLAQVATVLARQDDKSMIRVRGYTDSQGALSLNDALSQHRAEAVRDFLAAHGVAGDRLSAEGMGPANPVADNATPEGRADNRRVEIVVEPPSAGAGATPQAQPGTQGQQPTSAPQSHP